MTCPIRFITSACSLALAASTGVANAQTFHNFDPATLAQGGSGVAVSAPVRGTLMNPAAIAAFPADSRFNAQVTGLARVFDEDDLRESVDDFQDANYVDRTDASITNAEQTLADFESGTASGQDVADALRGLSSETESLNGGLQSVAGKPAGIEASAALVANVPNDVLSVGISYSRWAEVTATSSYDDDFLSTVVQDVDDCADAFESGNEQDCDNSPYIEDTDSDGNPDTITVDPESDLASRVFARGIAVEAFGITLARSFDMGNTGQSVPVTIGVTPKLQRIEVFDYAADVSDADEDGVDADRYTREHDDFNADVGALAQFGQLSTGVTVRNIIPGEYDTALGHTIDLDPVARAGVAYDGGWYSLVGDLDLTRNSSVGFTDDQRFVSAGGTISIIDWVHLRAGYRLNIAGDSRDVASVGLGLSPFRLVHIEAAVAGNSDEMGGSATLGMTF